VSKSELQRFVQDLGTNPALLAEAKKGDRFGAAEAVKIGSEHGYGFSLEEAKAFIQGRARAGGRELSEGQLDQVAGGFGGGCCMSNEG
jgi:predicted ribosomally synthesized peptide with nif11-like leader